MLLPLISEFDFSLDHNSTGMQSRFGSWPRCNTPPAPQRRSERDQAIRRAQNCVGVDVIAGSAIEVDSVANRASLSDAVACNRRN